MIIRHITSTYRMRDYMAELADVLKKQKPEKHRVTIEDVNRVLEVGRLLLSVLTPEELDQLKKELSNNHTQSEIGNTSVT
jgi:hypothetical protein